MSESPSIWYRIGYALERARQEPLAGRLRGLEERRNGGTAPKDREAPGGRQRDEEHAPTREDALDALIAAGAGALAGKVVGLVPARRSPGVFGLVHAGAAGAGAGDKGKNGAKAKAAKSKTKSAARRGSRSAR